MDWDILRKDFAILKRFLSRIGIALNQCQQDRICTGVLNLLLKNPRIISPK